MSYFGFLDILDRSIKQNAVQTSRDVLLALRKSYDITSELMKLILLTATNCDNEEILESFVSFIQSPYIKNAKVNLENQLALSILECNVRVTELLLRSGVRLSLETMEMHSFLEIFFRKEKASFRKDILTLLFTYGQLRTSYCEGENLLHRFIKTNKNDCDAVEVAEVLINSGVSTEEVNEEGWTPFLYSVSSGQLSLVSFFIKRGTMKEA